MTAISNSVKTNTMSLIAEDENDAYSLAMKIYDCILNQISPLPLTERGEIDDYYMRIFFRLANKGKNNLEAIQTAPEDKKTQITRKLALIYLAEIIPFYAIKQCVFLAKPDIKSSFDETPQEAGNRKVIVKLKQIYPKQHGILVATSIMTEIGSLLMKGLDAFFEK